MFKNRSYYSQWGLEHQTQNTECHLKSKHIKVWIWNGLILEWLGKAKTIAMIPNIPKLNHSKSEKMSAICFDLKFVLDKMAAILSTI